MNKILFIFAVPRLVHLLVKALLNEENNLSTIVLDAGMSEISFCTLTKTMKYHYLP